MARKTAIEDDDSQPPPKQPIQKSGHMEEFATAESARKDIWKEFATAESARKSLANSPLDCLLCYSCCRHAEEMWYIHWLELKLYP
ncbi:hypothetical protein QQ045_015142 [Rhodiola kirilowii]